MKRLLAIAAGLAGAFIVIQFTVEYVWPWFRPFPDEQELAHYREVCEPVIDWIEAQRELTGMHPGKLTGKYRKILSGIDPVARYRTFDRGGGSFFELSVGDYGKYWWVYYYHSPSGRWIMDQ